jgi:hypothetical protein
VIDAVRSVGRLSVDDRHKGVLSDMDNFHARTVFFVKDAERSLNFYTERP